MLTGLKHLALNQVTIYNSNHISLDNLTNLTSLFLEVRFKVENIPSSVTRLEVFKYPHQMPTLVNVLEFRARNHVRNLSCFPNLTELNIDREYDLSKLTKLKKLTCNGIVTYF